MGTKPSIAMIPSGYKTSKLYSVLPTDGSADLISSRSGIATRVNKNKIIETVGENVPRLDYSDGNCPSYLIEPQSTNINYSSELFDNAYYIRLRTTVNANETISPDGTQNADLISQELGNSNSGAILSSVLDIVSGSDYTQSVFVKKKEKDFVILRDYAASNSLTWFDINLGVIGDIGIGHTAEIKDYGNGWFRCSITYLANSDSQRVAVYLADANGVDDVVVGSGGVYMWGLQVEALSYPTSYIKTETTIETRFADFTSKTLTTDVFNKGKGTLFLDLNYWQCGGWGSTVMQLGLLLNGSQADAIGFVSALPSNLLRARIVDSSGGSDYIGGNFSPVDRNKFAIKWDGTNVSFYRNGVLFDSVANSGGQNYNTIVLPVSTRPGLFPINSLKLYDTALSNEELQQLTTI